MPKNKQKLLIPEPAELDGVDEEDALKGLAETLEQEKVEVAPSLDTQPLFAVLLRAAVEKTAPDDVVLRDYVRIVVPPISARLAHETAKGGAFAEKKLAEGKSADVVKRYGADQSLRAHLVNGLFPAAHVARVLRAWQAPRLSRFDEKAYRLLCAGFSLHDWLKLPEVNTWLEQAGLSHDKVNAARDLGLVKDIFREWGARLGLDEFLAPVGGQEPLLHDLIYIACNTQVRWGTMLNLAELPRQTLEGRTRQLIADLSRLADLVAYIGEALTPRELIAHHSVRDLITNLSDGRARLVAHHVAENRGALTNFIQSAALSALQDEKRVPLLYASSGVVYLERADTPHAPELDTVAEIAIEKIRAACKTQLANTFTGFSRDGKGLKRAPYYDLHFAPSEEIKLTARGVFKLMYEGKKSSAGKRYQGMIEKGLAPQVAGLDLMDDLRVDQLAEFCARVEKIIADQELDLDVAELILDELGLTYLRQEFDAIPRDNRAGGVAYHWYFAAGWYLKKHPGKDPTEWRELLEALAHAVSTRIVDPTEAAPGWDDVRAYVKRVLTLADTTQSKVDIQTMAQRELERYLTAKKRGQGGTAVCSLCSSSYTVDEQREAGILFAPQVYSNKQPLHSNKAIRNICQICAVEMMLRQILMNRNGATGGRFEAQRMRYLFFYPMYYFTPETLKAFESAYLELKRISVASLRKALVTEDSQKHQTLHLDTETFQRLRPLLLDPTVLDDPSQDRMFRLHYPTNEPVTFYFMGLPPPSRDAKDAEAWVNPAFLALVLPLALDVKVIASESPLPLMVEANEMNETVFLDAPHDFVKYIIGRERISLDRLPPRLRALTIAYLIHLDGNAGMGRGGFDYRWQDMPALARDLSDSSLAVFAYLKKWQRKGGYDSIPTEKAKLYLDYVRVLDDLKREDDKGGDSMSYAKELTRLYRGFYRADGFKSNAILKPIQLAAETILRSDPRLFGDAESLTEVVKGELQGLVGRIAQGSAEGRFPRGSDGASRAAAIDQFARYFVSEVFYGTLRGDKAALSGKQLNLLKNACETLYLALDAEERTARKNETNS